MEALLCCLSSIHCVSSSKPCVRARLREVDKIEGMPQKKYFRSRAHCNPLAFNESFEYPLNPEERTHDYLLLSSPRKVRCAPRWCAR